MTRGQHKALVSQALLKKNSDSVNHQEVIIKVMDNWAYRYYQFEKIMSQVIDGDTPISKLLQFEKQILKDPQYKSGD